MTSAVLYGTTSDNELRPVRVTDSGEFVTDGGGGGDWYANLYVGGTVGDPSISLLSDGAAEFAGTITAVGGLVGGSVVGTQVAATEWGLFVNNTDNSSTGFYVEGNGKVGIGYNATLQEPGNIILDADGTITAVGDVYARKFIDSDGYDLGKIGTALSTIHDVIESVDDLQGLKNLFHLLLDNLKTDPTPPEEL